MLVGLSGVYSRLGPVAVAVTIWVLVGTVLLAASQWGPLNRWWSEGDLRGPVGFHLTRFVGIWFLILYARGGLPRAFAVPGGIGDILAALGAIALLRAGLPRRGLLAWNIFGAVDILFVIVTALRLGLADPAQMAALRAFPLVLLPLFVVPVIIVTHILVFTRLFRPAA